MIGGMLADRVRLWRLQQAIDLKAKTEKILDDRGVTETQAVPLKLTVAIMEGATIEDDDDMHTLWARLLANALDPAFNEEVRIAYTDILKSLSPFDANLLNEIYDETTRLASGSNRVVELVEVNLASIGKRIEVTKGDLFLSRDCLIRQRLIAQMFDVDEGPKYIAHDEGDMRWHNSPMQLRGLSPTYVKLTQLGFAFLRSCR